MMHKQGSALVAIGMTMAVLPAAAQEQPGIVLVPGDSVSMVIDGQVRVTERQQNRKPSQFEARVIDLAAREMFPDAKGPNTADITTVDIEKEPIAPDTLTVRYFAVANGKGSLLVLANGYEKAVAYRARITVRGKTGPTDVCTVLPGRRGFEHWPYPIEKIELAAITLENWDGGRPRCE